MHDTRALKYVGVVIIDHPGPPAIVLDSIARLPTICITRRDWEFLHEQLGSAFAVSRYVERVAALPSVPLGKEIERYFRLASRDHNPAVDIRGESPEERQSSATASFKLPMLPWRTRAAEYVRLWEAVRDSIGDLRVRSDQEVGRQRALEILDSIPSDERLETVTHLYHLRNLGSDRIEYVIIKFPDGLTRVVLGNVPGSNDPKSRLEGVILYVHAEREIFDAEDERSITVGFFMLPNQKMMFGVMQGRSGISQDEAFKLHEEFGQPSSYTP